MTGNAAPFGFNVIGYLTSNSGIGVATRRVCELLEALAVPHTRFDVERTDAAREPGRSPSYSRIRASDLPFAINLMVIPINIVDLIFARFETEASNAGRLNAAICFWELSTIPPRWIASLDRLDVIVAMSDYMRQVYDLATSGPWIVSGRLPCTVPEGIEADRERFGIPADQVVFVSAFEPASDIRRKNPMGVVDAFLEGVGDDPRACLVVRVKNAGSTSDEHSIVAALRDRVDGHPRVRLVLEDLDYRDILTLYKSCDVFVSLHRAEGLGLGMLEAMALGMPVVATGWSGNMTFMDHGSACLVQHALVPVEADIPAYARDQLEDTTVWAEPDLHHAARWIRRLTDDRGFRLEMAGRAFARHAAATREAHEGRFIEELARIRDVRHDGGASKLCASTVATAGTAGTARTDRAGRLARIQALEQELSWIKGRPAYRLMRSVRRIFRSVQP